MDTLNTDDQAFLNAELQHAAESGDETSVKIVFLQYQQALFETLLEVKADTDLTLFKRRVNAYLEQTQRYLATVAVIEMTTITALVNESKTLFRTISELSKESQDGIQQQILVKFRHIRNG